MWALGISDPNARIALVFRVLAFIFSTGLFIPKDSMLKKLLLLLSMVLLSAGPALSAQEPTMHEIYQAAESGRFIEAQSMLDKVLSEHPNSAKAHFVQAGYVTLPGWSYRNMWWVSHNDHGAYCARGIHGQGIYIDPKAEMVIARFASHPMAGNMNLDPTTLPAYHALAQHLIASSS